MRKVLIFLLTGAVGVTVAACGSSEEKTADSYADQVEVQGFRLTDRYIQAGDTVLVYVGPSGSDVAAAVKAPGFDFGSSPPLAPTDGMLFEYLAEGYRIPYREMSCRLSVAQLKKDVASFDFLELDADETKAVKSGKSMVLELTIGCSEPG
ncbi:hypothetical protein ABGB07_31660 [Micromonosporaceae bacterium B7E4]